jgi:hypothetical protein
VSRRMVMEKLVLDLSSAPLAEVSWRQEELPV